ncbi:iron permease FTR1 [Candidatus Nitrosopumilus sediminis]|uniref:Iron permease FTR1 n=2 Tax=Candidatus Nitrosopumilus sediminis TaxID=1229909 RepID=K0BFA5_9ARCH|nr:iron permease FTR1 [Candidatus Nitrosopumilus sediminis]
MTVESIRNLNIFYDIFDLFFMKIRIIIVFLVFVACITCIDDLYAEQDSASIRTAVDSTFLGLEQIRDSLKSNNLDDAKKYSTLSSEIFGKYVQILRTTGYEHVDEIHISLLDLNSKIDTDTDVLFEIDKIQNLLLEVPYDQSLPDYVIVNLLSIADEKYQTGIQNNDEISYQYSLKLIQKAETMLSETNFDDRLDLEIKSFFNELNSLTEKREDFVKVGNLITVIQKDVLGTETVAFDQSELYQNIYVLYDELVESIDAGNYVVAEEKAIVAYLDNFEYLEPAIEKVDKELLYTLEIDMRENLRDMIKNNKSPDEIKQFLEEKIIPDLNKSESLVSEHLSSNPLLLTKNEITNDDGLKKMGDSTDEAKSIVRNEVDFIRDSLDDVVIFYENGDFQSAYATARTAYLDSYEFVEIPLRTIAPDFTLEVEYQFAELRNLIDKKEDLGKVREVVIAINRNLDESERLVSGTGSLAPSIAFTSSFAIIFREGLESVLILGAIMTYLEASRHNQLKKYIYYGVIAAFAATAITWIIASYIIEISGANRELIEAIAALSATAVLFYVSFWVLNKIEHKKWMEFVKAKVWQATTTGSVMVFVMLSFFTVYREGFETVLFYQAMSGFAKYMEFYVGLGFVLGILSLFGLYFVMRKLGKRLPLRALFGLTMGVGAYLSIAFLGNAIRELQILDIVPYTSMIGIIPRLDINLAAMTGIYPTLETVVAQTILLGVYLLASSYVLVLRPNKEKQLASMRKSRGVKDVQ